MQQNRGTLSERNEEILGEFMRLILFQSSKNIPTTRGQLGADIDFKKGMGFEDILVHAKLRFKQLFGYELYELPPTQAEMKIYSDSLASFQAPGLLESKKKKRKKPTKPRSKAYLLRYIPAKPRSTNEEKKSENNDIEEDIKQFNTSLWTDFHRSTHGLLMTIFGFILVSTEQMITEEQLWKALGTLGLAKSAKDHTTFGNVNDLLRQFTAQRYLKREKGPNAAGTEQVYYYKWGPRCLQETTRSAVYSLICKIIGEEESVAVTRRIAADDAEYLRDFRTWSA